MAYIDKQSNVNLVIVVAVLFMYFLVVSTLPSGYWNSDSTSKVFQHDSIVPRS